MNTIANTSSAAGKSEMIAGPVPTAPSPANPALDELRLAGAARALARRCFGIDERSLALFRVGLGLALLIDWSLRLDHISVFYTDMGVLPRAAALQFWDVKYLNSIFFGTGTYWGVLALMLPAGPIALAVLLGWRTRLMSALALVFMVSWQIRDFTVVQGSDDLLRMLLFWSLFLPTGRCWSIDAALDTAPRPSAGADRVWLSVGCAALMLQSSYVYFMGAVIKSGNPVWFEEATAVYYAMNIDQFTTWFSPYLRAFPEVMAWLTRFVFLLELLGPILLFCPWATPKIRLLVLAGLIPMHLGFKLFLQVGMFPLVSLISLTPFVPGLVWNVLEKRLRLKRAPAIAAMYFDEPCGFCRKTCLLLRTFLGLGAVHIAPAQQDPVHGELLRRHGSWVVRDVDGRVYLKWAALAAVFSASPIFGPFGLLMAHPRLQAAGERLYDAIGRNRMRLGTLTAPLTFRDNTFRRRPAVEALCLLLLGYVLWWNVSTLPGHAAAMPDSLKDVALLTRLEQKWDMFAPTPLLDDGWYVMRGRLADGTVVDALNARPGEPSFDKPADVAGMYPSQLWRKYMVNLAGQGYSPLRPWFARWACQQWNLQAEPGQELRGLDIYYVIERTQPPGQPPYVHSEVLWQGACT